MEFAEWITLIRETGSLGVLGLTVWLLFRYLQKQKKEKE